MDKLREIPPALSIKQPWADLILRREKTIEVREWCPDHRGPLLLHVSGTLDWKTVELLGYESPLTLPRSGIVAIADVKEVIEFNSKSWIELRPKHRVIHPPVREPLYGLILSEVIPLRKRVQCRGKRMLFPVPKDAESKLHNELRDLQLF